jgi:hypothetical protein
MIRVRVRVAVTVGIRVLSTCGFTRAESMLACAAIRIRGHYALFILICALLLTLPTVALTNRRRRKDTRHSRERTERYDKDHKITELFHGLDTP